MVDEDSARSVIEAFAAHGTDIPIDYEHQSLGGVYASPTGQAPAAGWIRALRAVAPEEADGGEAGLIADVAWTVAARERLSAKEYRYLSPVVIVRKGDRRMVALHSVALTNKPAIVGMKPIVNREGVSEAASDPRAASEAPTHLDMASLPAGEASEGCVMAGDVGQAVEMLRMRLGLPTDSDVETVLTAAQDRLVSLLQESAEREASAKVAAAFRAGKLTGAQRDWAMSLAMKDPAGFDAWAASAPTVVLLGRTEAPTTNTVRRKGREAIAASARAVFRSEPGLALLTSESAWVCEALREAGFESEPEDEQQGIETVVNGTHGMKRVRVS